ncbi:hypothetical protein F5B22DRAFT_641072 [Xylaria bambusicola]|uniref:uncharacterized protein n=1 Tax=Xylaria bambusicola TaxID=326684 RepID=UPI002007F625|nr:uncharacterized protein F5B22DRAFT_641072 [Xylaria bambusicola]KAI0528100.1 hypothetical protein F5B22DRAFT_641072 [Xylaria bambusicola]
MSKLCRVQIRHDLFLFFLALYARHISFSSTGALLIASISRRDPRRHLEPASRVCRGPVISNLHNKQWLQDPPPEREYPKRDGYSLLFTIAVHAVMDKSHRLDSLPPLRSFNSTGVNYVLARESELGH